MNRTMQHKTNKISTVSVIVPVFNNETGLKRCINAIAKQTYPMEAIEVIAVDNGSTCPLSIENSQPFQFRLIRCARPGSYAARNAGARVATGSVLAFIDADCWPDLDWVASGIRSLMMCNGIAIIAGEVSIIAPQKPSAVALYQYVTGFGQEENVQKKGFAATANLLCTRSQFEVVGPFNEELLSGGDLEWSTRARELGHSVVFAPEARVYTDPRVTLSTAIRQARRIVAGRKALNEMGIGDKSALLLAPRRAPSEALAWLLSRTELSVWNKARVVFAAVVIRAASEFERLRLWFGGRPERR